MVKSKNRDSVTIYTYFNVDCFQPFSIACVANMCNDRGDVRDFSLLDNIFWLEILFPSFKGRSDG